MRATQEKQLRMFIGTFLTIAMIYCLIATVIGSCNRIKELHKTETNLKGGQ
jgi:hypothetical protein